MTIAAQDILGRRLDQLACLQNYNLASAGTFTPIFTCGSRQWPSTDEKKTVIAFIQLSQITTIQVNGFLGFGIQTAPTDWGSWWLLLGANGTNPYSFPIGGPTDIGGPTTGIGQSGYAPGTVFGVQPIIAGAGTCTITAFGWAA